MKFTGAGIVQLRVRLNRTVELGEGQYSHHHHHRTAPLIGNSGNNANDALLVPAKHAAASSSPAAATTAATAAAHQQQSDDSDSSSSGIGNTLHEMRQRSLSGGRAIIYDTLPAGVIDDVELECMFEVTDTGIGISDEAQTVIFQPFTQAEPNTARDFGCSSLPYHTQPLSLPSCAM